SLVLLFSPHSHHLPSLHSFPTRRSSDLLEPLQIDNTFLGFVVRPGTNDVRVWFSPPTFWIGVWASVLTIIGLTAYSVGRRRPRRDRKSTRLNSSHLGISYAVFCLKKKKK